MIRTSLTIPTATIRHGLRRLWHWPLLVALVIGAHVALLAHQFEHHSHFDVATESDDCALCSFASAMAAAPDAISITPPTRSILANTVPALVEHISALCSCAAFRARAPPQHLSA